MDGGGSDKKPKLGRREVFIGGGGRRNARCVYGSVVVGGEALQKRGPCQRLGAILIFLINSWAGGTAYYGDGGGVCRKESWQKHRGRKMKIG